jgi:hypothetical protein
MAGSGSLASAGNFSAAVMVEQVIETAGLLADDFVAFGMGSDPEPEHSVGNHQNLPTFLR